MVKRPPPVIAIASPSETQQVTTDRVQLLGAAASDSGVAQIELRVNGQLVKQQDRRGATRVSNVDFAEPLILRAGKNEIAVTVIDMENQATTRALTVTRMPDPRLLDPGKIWAAVIGISQYKTVSSLQFLWLPGMAGHAGACVVTLPQVVVSKGKNRIRLWK